MRTPLVLLGLSSSAALPLGAQSAWLVGLGVERYDQADALASPLRYGATDPWIAVAWRHQGRTLSGVAVSFAPARLTARPSGPGSHYIDAWGGGLAGHWLRRVVGTRRSAIHIGARLDVFASARRQVFRPDAGTELYADLIAGLEGAAAWTWWPGAADELRQELSVPVMSAAMRTPYTGAKYLPSLMLGGPGRLTGIRYEVEYTRAVSGGLALGSRYTFDTFHYPDPRGLSVVSHRLGVLARFGGGGRR